MFCDSCGDLVKVAYPVTLTFAKIKVELLICLDCFDKGEISIDLKQRLRVAKILNRLRSQK